MKVYGTSEARHCCTAADLPIESHMTIAPCALRLTFISHGIREKECANWLDHLGSFTAAVAAQPAFQLLGTRDLELRDDYLQERNPAGIRRCRNVWLPEK